MITFKNKWEKVILEKKQQFRHDLGRIWHSQV